MGKLIHISEFSAHDLFGKHSPARYVPGWYLPNYSVHRKISDSVQIDFPHVCAIHQDRFEFRENEELSHNTLRVAIRKFVERRIEGDVIYRMVDKSYGYVPSYHLDKGRTWDSEKKSHGYYLFHFETATEATAFSLFFAEYIDAVSDRHPDGYPSEREIEAYNGRFGNMVND